MKTKNDAASSSSFVLMPRWFMSLLIVVWWVWFGVQLAITGSMNIAIELLDRVKDAWSESVQLMSLARVFGAALGSVAYKWGLVVAPFVSDMISFTHQYVYPFFMKSCEVVWPYLKVIHSYVQPTMQFLWLWVLHLTMESFSLYRLLPVEVQLALLYFPIVFICARYDGRLVHLYVPPFAWFCVKFFSVGDSRVPLVFVSVIYPFVLSSVYLIRSNKSTDKSARNFSLSLLSYWSLFPLGIWSEPILARTVVSGFGIAQSSYTIFKSIMIFWLLKNNGATFILDWMSTLSWSFFGKQVVDVVTGCIGFVRQLAEKNQWKAVQLFGRIYGIVERVKNMRISYLLISGSLVALIALYWAFSVTQRILSVAVWPWFFFETSKICLSRSDSLYRSTMSFALVFLFFEFGFLKYSPYPVIALGNLFHLPIVFLIKTLAEPAVDFMIKLGIVLRGRVSTRNFSPLEAANPKTKSE